MFNKNRSLKILTAIVFLAAICYLFAGRESFSQTTVSNDSNANAPKAETVKRQNSDFSFPTLYWAVPRPIALLDWHTVFGGTVVKVKKQKRELFQDFNQKIVGGEIKIERIFLDLPDGSKISINDKFYGEDFENLKKGDKVIVFVNGFYEKRFVRIKIDGTNSALGLKVKDWNDPIVPLLEKLAPCDKITETWVEGHKRDFRTKLYGCRSERDKMILENAEIWKRYDPKGLAELLEMQEFLKESETQNSSEKQ